MPTAPKMTWTAKGHRLDLREASADSLLSTALAQNDVQAAREAVNQTIDNARGVLRGHYSIKFHPNSKFMRGDLIVHTFRGGKRLPDYTYFGEIGNASIALEDFRKKHGYPSYPLPEHRKAEVDERKWYGKKIKETGGIQ